MKKMIFIFLLVFGLAISACGQVKVYTDQIITDSASFNGTSWVNEFSTDGTLAGNSDRAVPTEKAVKTYAATIAGDDTTGIGVRIASIIDDTSKYINRYDTATWATQILSRITADDTTGIGVRIASILDDTSKYINRYDTAAYSTAILSRITADDTSGIGARIAATEDDIAAMKDTVEVQMVVTDSTLSSSELETGNVFVVSERLDGYLLTRVKIYSPDINGGTITADVYRTRTTQVKMTSVAATLTSSTNTAATINASYDDVAEGDWIEIKYTDNGATSSIGLNIVLLFKKP